VECSNVCRRIDRDPAVHEDRRRAAPTTCVSRGDGDGCRWTTNATPLLDESKLGPHPSEALADDDHARNNLPDALTRWLDRDDGSVHVTHPAVLLRPKSDIAAQATTSPSNRYKEVVHEVEHRPPLRSYADLEKLKPRSARLSDLEAIL